MGFIEKFLKKCLRQMLRKNSTKNLKRRQKLVIDIYEHDSESSPIQIETGRSIEETATENVNHYCLKDSGSDREFSSTEESVLALDRTHKRRKHIKERKYKCV
jgi:hypothetical protein